MLFTHLVPVSPPLAAVRASVEIAVEDWHGCLSAIDEGGARLSAIVARGPEQRGPEQQFRAGSEHWRMLHTIRYDPEANEIEIALGHGHGGAPVLRHFVAAPRSIHIEESDHAKVVVVHDSSGVNTRIQLIDLDPLVR